MLQIYIFVFLLLAYRQWIERRNICTFNFCHWPKILENAKLSQMQNFLSYSIQNIRRETCIVTRLCTVRFCFYSKGRPDILGMDMRRVGRDIFGGFARSLRMWRCEELYNSVISKLSMTIDQLQTDVLVLHSRLPWEFVPAVIKLRL